jgi:hypothetical protein
MRGETMLQQAASLVAKRRKTYGDPRASMTAIAQRWSITLGRKVTPQQVALCLIDLSPGLDPGLARLAHNAKHRDSILDVAGYAAVLQEVAR